MRSELSDKKLLQLYRGFYIFGDSASLKILYELDLFGEKTFSELRDELKINPTTLSKKLKILKKVGLIQSSKKQDNLRVYYSIDKHQKPLRKFLDSLDLLSRKL